MRPRPAAAWRGDHRAQCLRPPAPAVPVTIGTLGSAADALALVGLLLVLSVRGPLPSPHLGP